MNLKKLIVFLVLSLFCIPTGFVFAENPDDLELDEGKSLLLDLREVGHVNTWYLRDKVYKNVNIGAGTKVTLDSQWEYIYKGSHVETSEYDTESEEPQDITETTVYEYAKEENLATLSIDPNGQLILNSGSELALRNQYNLVTSSHNVSVQYQKDENRDVIISTGTTNYEEVCYQGKEKNYNNRMSQDTSGSFKGNIVQDNSGLFLGDIVFENGDSDTKLTFGSVSKKTSDSFVLPEANGSSSTVKGGGYNGGDLIEKNTVKEIETYALTDKDNIVLMQNDFQIKSNRAVINVDFDGRKEEGEWDPSCGHVALGAQWGSKLSGDGTIVKQGVGVLYLRDDENASVNGDDLTGANTGYSWRIEEGTIRVNTQSSLGTKGKIYIDSGGSLSLNSGLSVNPPTAIEDIKRGLVANVFTSSITSAGGGISIVSGSIVELAGDLETVEGHDSLGFSLYENSALVLSGTNNAKNFYINFGGIHGGAANYLVTDVEGLATNSINVTNTTGEDYKDFAFFELALKENSNVTYSGSLNGEMYLHKLGTGTVTLTGNNTYTKGTYITEGGLLLATSNSIGTGNILFDNDTENPEDFASIGVAEGGNIDLINNIHVKKGAILNVLEGQNMYLKGDLVRYDARPGYEAKFIKNGLGNAIISQI